MHYFLPTIPYGKSLASFLLIVIIFIPVTSKSQSFLELWKNKGGITHQKSLVKTDVTHPSMLEKNIATLEETNACPNCYLKGAFLWGANLGRADLEKANLEGAVLRGSNLEGANLSYSNLEGVKFGYATMKFANLKKANLQRVNLKFVSLQGANLQGAKLDPEGIRIARTSGAINIPKATIIAKNKSQSRSCPGTY